MIALFSARGKPLLERAAGNVLIRDQTCPPGAAGPHFWVCLTRACPRPLRAPRWPCRLRAGQRRQQTRLSLESATYARRGWSLAVVWPIVVAVVDNECVGMDRPAVRAEMRVVGRQVSVAMRQDLGVTRWPEHGREGNPTKS